MTYRSFTRLLAPALALALGVSAEPRSAAASWPIARHDPTRAAAAAGVSDLTNPAAYWRVYLGGAVGPTQFDARDIDGDGKLELFFATSGRVIAKHDDDSIVWQSAPLGISEINALSDLDGDGHVDVVVSGNNSRNVYVLDGRTGAIQWTEPDGEMGTIGGVRVGDVDGDGRDDLVIQECGCCGINSGKTGFIYSFAAGFNAATLLWTMPFVTCGGHASLTLVDVDGNASKEVLLGHNDHFEIFDGKTGTKLGVSEATSGAWNGRHVCRTLDLDGVAGEEVVCVLNDSTPPGVAQRRVSVLRYDLASQALHVAWTRVISQDSGGDVRYVDPVVDLDGDGKYEVVVSSVNANTGGWRTFIVDALAGTDLVPAIDGQITTGSLELTKKGSRVLLTRPETAPATVGWSFVRTPNATLTKTFSIADDMPLAQIQRDRSARYGAYYGVVAIDLDHDGLDDVVTMSSDAANIAAYSGAGGTPKLLARRALPAGVDVQRMWILPSQAMGPLAFARSDGYLEILADGLTTAECCGEFPRPLAIRVGGFYAAGGFRAINQGIRTAPLGQGLPDSVVVGDSRRALLRFDPKDASWAVPPSPTWEKPNTFAPSIVPGLIGGATGIACYGIKPGGAGYLAQALRADGTPLWSTDIETTPMNDLVPAKLDGDATPDLVASWGSPSDAILHVRGLSGSSGNTLWNAVPVSPGAGRQPAGISVANWNGDAVDDLLLQGPNTYVLDGKDGQSLVSGGSGASYFLPIPYDIDGDSSLDVVVQAGYSPVSVFSHDLTTTLYSSPDDDRPYPYGAMATCPSGPVLVEGSSLHPARLKMTSFPAGTVKTVVLARGALVADEASAGAGYLGQLTSTSVHANLTGKGHPSAIVGSTDGYVYAVDPCTGTLDFAVGLGVAVGEGVFGDTDGDGRDELFVTAADGFLYAIKNRNVASPTDVIDTDRTRNITVDVDEVESADKLSASWGAAAGASGYEVAVVDELGRLVAPWRNVGTELSAEITGLTLQSKSRYFVAVRALSPTGPSVDAVSDGVRVLQGVPSVPGAPGNDGGVATAQIDPEAPAESGCGCGVIPSRVPAGIGLFSVVSVLGLALRRSRARKRA